MKTEISFKKYLSNIFYLLILVMIILVSCNSYVDENYNYEDIEILKIGGSTYRMSDFERSSKTFEESGISKDSSIRRTIKTCFYNSAILNHLTTINFELPSINKKELLYLNRKDLIKF